MKKLTHNYYIAFAPNGKLIARFTNKNDALKALPTKPRCFGNAIPMGTVHKITAENIVFSQPYYDNSVIVFESYDEYLNYLRKTKNINLQKEKEKENEQYQ